MPEFDITVKSTSYHHQTSVLMEDLQIQFKNSNIRLVHIRTSKTAILIHQILFTTFEEKIQSIKPENVQRKVENWKKKGKIALKEENESKGSTLHYAPTVAQKISKGPLELINTADPQKQATKATGKEMTEETWALVQNAATEIANKFVVESTGQQNVEESENHGPANLNTSGKVELKQKLQSESKSKEPHTAPKYIPKAEESRMGRRTHEEIASIQQEAQQELKEEERLAKAAARIHAAEQKDAKLYDINHTFSVE